jgi:hypothetical protein
MRLPKLNILLLTLALCLTLAAPVIASGLTFQDTSDLNSVWLMFGGAGYPSYSYNSSAGNSFIYNPYFSCVQNRNQNQFTYLAWSLPAGGGYWGNGVELRNTANVTMTSMDAWATNTPGGSSINRAEIVIVGTTARQYYNGLLALTRTGLTQNPSYFGICDAYGGGADMNVDDLIFGDNDTTSKYVVGVPQSNAYYIKKDMINPSASGLFNSSTDTLVSSTYMSTTFGRSTVYGNASENLYLINVDTGTVYDTQPTGNYTAGNIQWNINSKLIMAGAPYGRYQIKFGDYYSDEIMYIANGATISFDKSDYNQNDIAYLTYLIDGAYWDTSTYTYSIKIYRANDWSVIHTQGITSSTGTDQYQFTSSDTQGTYYAVVIATPNVGGDEIWMIFDYAQMNAYFAPYGYVNDAETAQVIAGANVTLVQGSTVLNMITDANGNYTATNLITGLPIIWNVTAAGHFQYNVTMTAMTTGSKFINITLNSTSPSFTGLGIGGVARDGILTGTTITGGYGRPIPGETSYLRNISTGEYCTNVSNNAGWYKFDEGNGCYLTTKRPYEVWGSKIGYSNSSTYTVVAA